MDKFYKLIEQVMPIWAFIFLGSILAGAIYGAQMLGFSSLDNTLLNAPTARSLHITLMLYGPIMLALSLLPFALFAKDKLDLSEAVEPLKNYFLLWHLFLFMAVVSISLGAQRGLPFYDFAYELNFILAASGIFYIIAIFKSIKHYEITPLWVKVSKVLLFVAPLALLVLMNPTYGQVEKTLIGPHGDNTLGMSFTLIPLFYLMIKLHTKENFIPKWHIFWILPLAGYALSVATRIFIGELSYNEEWVYQWLTFAYAPLLIKWYKDAKITYRQNPYLLISIWAFLFVMIQGNILFIPEIRWPFHRNDLIVAHAHVAIGLGIFFMSLSILKYFYKLPEKFIHFWLLVIGLIFVSLSLAGFDEAAVFAVDVIFMWQIRLIAGIVAVIGLTYYIVKKMKIARLSRLQFYHLNGFLSDGLGALILFLSAPLLFEFLGLSFSPYYYLVFGFMGFVGILHLIGVTKEAHFLAYLTSIARLITGTVFFSLFYLGTIDSLGLLVGFYDISYALLYLIFRSRL
ncbi:MAG: hypothetical protein A3E21_01240 [Sulfurimonas sp. RIFCSPHIGHO2_12_FULL_36_9]|uniref:hypothetical protein n=1 Tax=Sulfurimonas sp. RIFCSPLOWO2_12_36_12 TaxID=1802253 RepID=UPI0008B55E14|nr:hypothetical protein [Sulfurimonas sp. RIFCSPLOWO2_12_36_12]OHD96666.1 MAG: hypothetical protein A3E21_01240 [Sulfurimonas sp. RIFCSPHIGHO2_12_FULL_36_9]OHE00185.1 MAG: hypothetical protein A2W82_02955 [Sulfurimonas sp. RIFCSPLOWO2_12_36_12]OHE00798.1 MAG: hypothetical protein A3J26_02915 [Sulfurimonas sp. RIFCSPLOWO2_02_FULL_36_28]OHE08548.1 MAG: hypothetical protein A3K14_04360 [Sulfurimonas sp. RIFCSPLOWO2_12_FULL_36_74]